MDGSVSPILISAIAGVFLPPIVEFVKVKLLPDSTKRWVIYVISLVLSVLIGGAAAYITLEEFSWEMALATIVSAQVIYNLFWKSLHLDDKMEASLAPKK